MISVNTNIANLRAQNCLTTASNQLATIMERLSTGYRINTAKDDAAGLYVGTSLNTQIRGLQQANKNTQIGADLLGLADGSLSQMTNNLLRVRDLAVQAANGIYTAEQRAALQDEADHLISEITRIKETTKFNGKNIFSPEAGGANAGAAGVSGGGRTHKTAAELDTEYGAGNWVAVTTREELEAISKNLNKTYVLMGDINLMGVEWDPIMSFKGTFDGNGYTISNLNINSNKNLSGLFELTFAGSTLKNVHINGGTIKGTGKVGSLVGEAHGKIENCSSTANVEGRGRFVGGLVGWSDNLINNSYSTGNVVNNNLFTGGLVGYTYALITNCYSTGNVSATSHVGGLAGNSSSSIINCYTTGNIVGGARTGGLIGGNDTTTISNITNSISTSTVTRKDGSTDNKFGSLHGSNNFNVSNSYALEQNFNFASTAQNGVTEKPAEYFDDPAVWESVLGSEFDYSTVPPQLKSNPIPKPNEKINLQVGANFGDEDAIQIDTTFNMSGFSLNFTTEAAASKSIAQIDALLNIITTKRTEIGAVSNRLDSILNSQLTKIENYASAKSTIMDSDIAKESANLVSKQILQQASSSLLLQTGNIQKSIIGQLINGL